MNPNSHDDDTTKNAGDSDAGPGQSNASPINPTPVQGETPIASIPNAEAALKTAADLAAQKRTEEFYQEWERRATASNEALARNDYYEWHCLEYGYPPRNRPELVPWVGRKLK